MKSNVRLEVLDFLKNEKDQEGPEGDGFFPLAESGVLFSQSLFSHGYTRFFYICPWYFGGKDKVF